MSISDLGTLKILSPKTVNVVVGCFYRLSGGFGINFLSPRRSYGDRPFSTFAAGHGSEDVENEATVDLRALIFLAGQAVMQR
jgi:hypothetical protein